ncbi:MAG: HD domain-containing protein [Phycisphaerales bacterium]|nr:HD domain-containing protein [Phycisphaerales bacterium]
MVADPQCPTHDLLRPGVELDAGLLKRLQRRGVTQLWIDDDLTRDLDHAVAPRLTAAKRKVFAELRTGLADCARRTITTASIQNYRAAALEMVVEAISSAKYAALTDAVFSANGQASHSANVAYLSLICGLHLESWVVSEQPRLRTREAREMSVLGVAGMLHDIGKTRLAGAAGNFHDIHALESGGDRARPDQYDDHPRIGKAMLESCRVPARVAYAVLHHHQRFNGEGWPDIEAVGDRIVPPLEGRRIHVFARIIAAANVLDSLLSDADGARVPPVAALHAFASPRFDGWFDPVVRQAMLLRIPPFAVGTDVRLSDGRRAVVTEPTPCDPCRPRVRTIPEDGADPESIDLHETPALSITHALGVDVTRWIFEPPVVGPMNPLATDESAEAA